MVDAMEVSSIKITTDYDGDKYYSFFTKKDKNGSYDARCAVVFGRNGVGKSTIARVLSGECSDKETAEFYDLKEVSLGCDCSNVHVFSEKYVIENFRVYKSDHLTPVILLGDYVKVIEGIDNLRNQILRIEESISQKNQNFLDGIWGVYTLEYSNELYADICRKFVEAYIYNLIHANRHAPVRYSRLRKSLLDGIFEGDRSSRDQSFYRFISLGFKQSMDKIKRIG